MTRPRPAIERIMARVTETPGPLDTPCWITTYASGDSGYVSIGLNGSIGPKRRCHIVTYEHFVGPVPDGLHLDHLCRVRNCVSPAHLEPVTAMENVHRSEHPNIVTWRTNVCKRGHSMEDAYVEGDHKRRCRLCTLLKAAGVRTQGSLWTADDPRHGTLGGYSTYGCRCDECRTASNAYQNAYRARKRAEIWAFISPPPVEREGRAA